MRCCPGILSCRNKNLPDNRRSDGVWIKRRLLFKINKFFDAFAHSIINTEKKRSAEHDYLGVQNAPQGYICSFQAVFNNIVYNATSIVVT